MSVIAAVNALPQSGLTVTALQTLDKIIPGEWDNVTRFDDMVAEVCGDGPPKLHLQVAHTARAIETRDGARYDRAVQIYSLVDSVDKLAAGAAVAGKVGALFGNVGFLKKFTPKPDTTQALDAGVKLVAELLAFGTLHGMPTADADGLARFTGALADYARYDLMRIASWVVFDGVIPLGPNFVQSITSTWGGLATSTLSGNPVFKQLAGQLPGSGVEEKQAFVIKTLNTTGEWVNRFVEEKGISQEAALQQVQQVIGVADGGLDMVAAALDATTDVFTHTGTQTVGRALAKRALEDLREQSWKQYVAGLA